jgi:hypothetical protein
MKKAKGKNLLVKVKKPFYQLAPHRRMHCWELKMIWTVHDGKIIMKPFAIGQTPQHTGTSCLPNSRIADLPVEKDNKIF